jgi:hypothetical protein
MLKRIFSFSNLTLLVALILSTIAAWYSIIGLTTIFAGAVVPVIIMGSALELAKITTTVWLRKYWHRAGLLLKLYLVPAVMAIALITSMGIFGFLSKAHMDQGVTSGDVQAKISIYDEKIKTSKDNIDANRKALKQMDEAVDQVMGRSSDEKGAEKAVAIRRGQAKERVRLQAEIIAEQKTISQLSEQRAPIAAEVRKVEAEVGPIKYIAALLYGDNPDANILERAVRWVIILLVIVFDPLAIALVLAANASKDWDKEEEEDTPAYEADYSPISDEVLEQLRASANKDLPTGELISKEELFPLKVEPEPIQVHKPEPSDDTLEPCYKCGTTLINAPGIGPFCPNKECDVLDGPYIKDNEPIDITYIPPKPVVIEPVVEKEMTVDSTEKIVDQDPNFEGIKVDGEWLQTGPAFKEIPKIELADKIVANTIPFENLEGGYVMYDGKHMHKDVLVGMHPDMLKLVADSGRESKTSFGTTFPSVSTKGDTFVRVDTLPNKVYKFDGTRWIVVNKEQSTSYLHDQEYIKYLVKKIEAGEYDIELLSDIERQQIEEYLTKSN